MTVSVIRPPAAAGRFYPKDASSLAWIVDGLLSDTTPWSGPQPWGVVVPHAGYRYSGPVAANAYATVRAWAGSIRRVVVLGPAHFVSLEGCAVPSASAWRTPLGSVPIDTGLRDVAEGAGCAIADEPHIPEHAIEVQLPFLQGVFEPWCAILPIAVGRTTAGEVADLLGALDPVADLVVVSSDLSHYEDLATARSLDRRTADAVVSLDPEAIGPWAACGVYAMRGAVAFARGASMRIQLLDLRTSGDTVGDPERVVGYGAFAILPLAFGVEDARPRA